MFAPFEFISLIILNLKLKLNVKTQRINLAQDFSRFPAGRYRSDGPYSGQVFREEFLVPALKRKNQTLEVDLDGALGYGSSFLKEAFGGLVHDFSQDELKSQLKVRASDPSLTSEVWSYIHENKRTVH